MDTDYWGVVLCMLIVATSGLFVIGMFSVTVGGTLVEDVQSAPYSIYEYKLNKFDCTDMSAIMEVHLTERGHDARLLVLRNWKAQGHAMVVVYNHTDNRCVFVESTAKRIVDHTFTQYDYVEEYDNIVDVVENSRWGVGEWGLKLYIQEKARI